MSHLCRLCAVEKDNIINIFSDKGYTLAISSKVNQYIRININENDQLPKNICHSCYSMLVQYSDFVDKCHEAQLLLKSLPFNDRCMKEEDTIIAQDIIYNHSDNTSNLNSECFKSVDVLEDTSNIINTHSNGDELINEIEIVCKEKNSNELIKRKLPRRNHILPARYNSCNSSANIKGKLRRKNAPAQIRKRLRKTKLGKPEEFDENESEYFKQKYFNEIGWLCTECENKFDDLSDLQQHHLDYHGQTVRYMCPFCYKVYTRYPGFGQHMKNHQTPLENTCCSVCGKYFSTLRNLKVHMIVHSDERPFKCSTCAKSFKQLSTLQLHSKSHLLNEKKFQHNCNQCNKSFSNKQNLFTHRRIHANIKNFICEHCGKDFVQKGNLVAHIATHVPPEPYICKICSREFKSAVLLRKHAIVHTSNKPYQCDICGRTFREHGTLKAHFRIHSGAMPYTCEYCGKAFRFQGVLINHRRQHTGERPYSCLECQHCFTNWPNYNKHMKRRHGISMCRNRLKEDSVQQNVVPNEVAPPFVDTMQTINEIEPSFVDTMQTINEIDNSSIQIYYSDLSAINDPNQLSVVQDYQNCANIVGTVYYTQQPADVTPG